MNFNITLHNIGVSSIIPINYQYSLSVALYRIIARGEISRVGSLHGIDSVNRFNLFTFSQIYCRAEVKGDHLQLLDENISFRVSFHLPQTMGDFIKALFQYEKIDIADDKSQATFMIKSIESIPNTLPNSNENEQVHAVLKPNSLIVAGIPDETGRCQFLSPDDSRFVDYLISNWRSKIAVCYGDSLANSAILLMKIHPVKLAFEPRLISFKTEASEELEIKGWINLEIEVTTEKRFVELLLNSGVGMYNALGCGSVEI